MPEWITDEFYEGLRQAFEDSEDYIDGQGSKSTLKCSVAMYHAYNMFLAGFGLPDDTELLRLRGGFMLGELVKNMWNAVNNATATKYFAYSAVSLCVLSYGHYHNDNFFLYSTTQFNAHSCCHLE